MNTVFQGLILVFFLGVMAFMIWDARTRERSQKRPLSKKCVRTEPEIRLQEASEAAFEERVIVQSQTKTRRFTVLHVMALSEQGFKGERIWQVATELDLVYGEKQVFHAYDLEGRGILFSLVSAVNPGTFELNALSDFSTPGLTFILMTTEGEGALAAFEKMLETAQSCATLLEGECQDENHLLLSHAVIQSYRQRLIEQVQSELVS